MRISDWSSDVCSSDLGRPHALEGQQEQLQRAPVRRWPAPSSTRLAHAAEPMVQKIGICLLRDEYSVVTAASRKPLADYFRGQHRTGRSGDGQSAIPRSGYLAAGE